MRRRRDQAEESRGVWLDFERTTPISDPEPPEVTEPDVTEPERAETVTVAEE